MNQVILAGNVGMDPELRATNGGGSVLKLRVATTDRYKDRDGSWKESTDWHNVVMFGARTAGLHQYLRKGDFVVVRGKLRTSSYDNKEGQKVYRTEVIADDVELTGRKDGGERAARRDTPRDDFGYGSEHIPQPSDDDIPF